MFNDLTGKKFGYYTVLEYIGKTKHYKPLWKCRCKCGTTKIVLAPSLINGSTRSCGCLAKEKVSECNSIDIKNQKFGKLSVLEKITTHRHKNRILWRCQCDCGNICEKTVTSLRGGTQSCGCIKLNRLRSQVGSLNPSWNTSFSKEERLEKLNKRQNNVEFIKWSKAVKKRDNYICQICKENNDTLRSHHIDNWSEFHNKRYDLENGICLCDSCHKHLHKIYGLKATKNTYECYYYIRMNEGCIK